MIINNVSQIKTGRMRRYDGEIGTLSNHSNSSENIFEPRAANDMDTTEVVLGHNIIFGAGLLLGNRKTMISMTSANVRVERIRPVQ